MIAAKGSRTQRPRLHPFSLPAPLPSRKLYHSGCFWLQVKKINLQLQCNKVDLLAHANNCKAQGETLWASGKAQHDPGASSWEGPEQGCVLPDFGLGYVSITEPRIGAGRSGTRLHNCCARKSRKGEELQMFQRGMAQWPAVQAQFRFFLGTRRQILLPSLQWRQVWPSGWWNKLTQTLETFHPQPFMLFPPLRACPFRHGDLGGCVLQMAEPQDGRSLRLWVTVLKESSTYWQHWSFMWLRNFCHGWDFYVILDLLQQSAYPNRWIN